MPFITANDRQRRILQLSEEWDVALPVVPSRQSQPKQRLPSYCKPGDDNVAEDLLRQRAAEAAQGRPRSGLSRAFSMNNLKRGKAWAPRLILDTLMAWVAQDGSAGVAEALIARLEAAGVDVGGGQPPKTGVLRSRRRSADTTLDQTQLLRMAVLQKQQEMVHVLLPYAHPAALDACLAMAIHQGSLQILDLLLSFGASVARSEEAETAFRNACCLDDRSDLVRLILESDGRPSPLCVSQSLIEAAAATNLDTVLYLSRSTGDGNYETAKALKVAVALGRRDIALAIVMGNNPPLRPGLDEAFQLMLNHVNLGPMVKLDLAELLLCSGAGGECISRALKEACESGFSDMARALVRHGASIEYDGASALKHAISRSQLDSVSLMLSGSACLDPSLASECIRCIPKHATFEARFLITSLLLRKGAHGTPLSECLVDAARAGDAASVDLLVKPIHALERRPASSPDLTMASDFQSAQRHEVASPDFKNGEALRAAVLQADLSMTQMILSAQPSSKTMSSVFPLTKSLPPPGRYDMVELFLKGALTGPCLHQTLHDALEEDGSRRDDALIKLLLRYDADVNYDQGRGLRSVILQADLGMVGVLVQQASPQIITACVADVMLVADHRTRFDMMKILLRAVPKTSAFKEIAEVLLETLREKPVDMSLLRLLLEEADADVNALDGAILKQSVLDPDPKVLELVLSSGKLLSGAIAVCLGQLAQLPSTEGKACKLGTTLAHATRDEDLNGLLVGEVKSLLRNDMCSPSLSTLAMLLEAGADTNAFSASALCQSVIAANTRVFDLVLHGAKPPTSTSLGHALPHALRLEHAADRLLFTEKLVMAGPSPSEVNRALIHAIGAFTGEIPLLAVLAAAADMSDGEALYLAVSKESDSLLDLLLAKSTHSMKTRDPALRKAVNIQHRDLRYAMCKRLLGAGVSSEEASEALLVTAREGDARLSDELIAHGADISSTNGRAVIEACRGGSVDILDTLLKSSLDTEKLTLERGFQAATEIHDLNKRAAVFERLLQRGVRGDVVDAQLQSAARYGSDGEMLLRILLAAGADPNYNNGEAVLAATRSAFTPGLELLLGLWDEEKRQKRPSTPTLLGAFKASWTLSRDIRFQIIDALFKAGLPSTDDLHKALNDAVNEENAEERLVSLLLSHGASPAANECKTLVDATRNAASSSLKLLLDRELPEESINRAFSEGFHSSNFKTWYTESGLQTMRTLLNHGACGDVITHALVCVARDAPADREDLATSFSDLLLPLCPDINCHDGLLLNLVASRGNVAWTHELLEHHPSSQALVSGIDGVLDASLPQEVALALVRLFTGYHDGETRVDVMAVRAGAESTVVRALSQYPRSEEILRTLLDAGYWYDQVTTCKLHPDMDSEEVTLLTWAIAQPQKRVSTPVIQLLIDRGAKVNVPTKSSGITPLMLAVQTRRPDVVESLLAEGAEVDVEDFQSRTPLSLATQIGGDLAVQMMKLLLAADPSKDDGSLHNAARDLNLSAVKALVDVGHAPDFPSPLHDGRSALAEVCLHGSSLGSMSTEQEKAMLKVMSFLIESGSDLTIKSHGRSILHLCFEAIDPVTTSRLLLRAGMWKHVNKPFNHYVHGRLTYSPTMYIRKVLVVPEAQDALLTLLYANRAVDEYYATSGPQPEGATGLPEDLKLQERERMERLERLAEESQELAQAASRKRELANIDSQIVAQRAQMEDARRQTLHEQDLAFARSRAQLENSLASASTQRRLSEQRALATAERDADEARQRKTLEWEGKAHRERVENARALSAIRISEREEVERVEKRVDDRMQRRLEAQGRLLEGQERLARVWADGSVQAPRGRPQIGYVTEER